MARNERTFHWDRVSQVKFTYIKDYQKKMEATMISGNFGASTGYQVWQKHGLKLSDWTKYSENFIYDDNIKLEFDTHSNLNDTNFKINEKMSCSDIMNKLKGNKDF